MPKNSQEDGDDSYWTKIVKALCAENDELEAKVKRLEIKISSYWTKIVKALYAQIDELEAKVKRLEIELEANVERLEIELEAKVERLEIEVSEMAGKWACTEHELEKAKTQCNDLCLRLDYFRRNFGDEPDYLDIDF